MIKEFNENKSYIFSKERYVEVSGIITESNGKEWYDGIDGAEVEVNSANSGKCWGMLVTPEWCTENYNPVVEIKINQKEKNFVPLTCEKSKEIVAKGWKAYDILLIGDKNENLVIKICLNENKELNFAVSVKINENCKEYIDKIEELKIINIE